MGPIGEETVTLRCPQFHETPDAPLGRLSRALDTLSITADASQSYLYKSVALFLQMTLFGPIKQFFEETYAPAVLLTERHPVVDTLAYGPFYVAMMAGDAGKQVDEEVLRQQVDLTVPGGFELIECWNAWENRRLGAKGNLVDLASLVAEKLTQPLAEQLAFLTERYRTGLPDAVVMLDAPTDVLLSRLAARGGGGAELHERGMILEQIRGSYLRSFEYLRTLEQPIRIEVIDTEAVEQTALVDQVLELVD